MKKRHIIIGVLAVLLVFCSTIGESLAYFSTYATARGGYTIKSEPDIHEEFTQKNKAITITNKVGASPVFVRVKVFNGSEFKMEYGLGENWSVKNYDGVEDGYFYYTQALDGGQATTVLNATIKEIPERLKDKDEFNIVVIYESVLAVADGGNLNMAESWNMAR